MSRNIEQLVEANELRTVGYEVTEGLLKRALWVRVTSFNEWQYPSFFQKIVVYLIAILGITRNEVIERVKESDNTLKSETMTFIDEFIEEGIEIGIERGIERGIEMSILKFYKKGMPTETIADYMELPLSDVKQIITKYLIEEQKNESKH